MALDNGSLNSLMIVGDKESFVIRSLEKKLEEAGISNFFSVSLRLRLFLRGLLEKLDITFAPLSGYLYFYSLQVTGCRLQVWCPLRGLI